MHAEKCPICDGEVKFASSERICHGCNGKGWVEVQDSMPDGYWPWYSEPIKYGFDTYTGKPLVLR